MKSLLSSRFLLVAIILIVSVVLLAQNMGIAGSHAPTEKPSATDTTLAASPPPQMDWALAGLLIGGAVITLIRPRRRKVVPVTTR